jgi:hypothetical protein
VTGYHPMTLAELGGRLVRTSDAKVRWKLVWEFLEEYRWEQAEAQPLLLLEEPTLVGDERWDALLAALAEHLAARLDLAPRRGLSPGSCGGRGFPRNCRSRGPRHWSGLPRRSASTASTCQPGTWTPRDRS